MGGDAHWHALHDVVSHAREHTLKTLGGLSAIDGDRTLSATGKAEKKKEIGSAALAALQESQHLNKARAAVEAQNERWETQLGLRPKVPDALPDLMLLAEIRGHIAATKENRIGFVLKHADDPRVLAAVLCSPAFLSGLTDAEVEVLKIQIAKRNNPSLAEARDETLRAISDLERGVRAAAALVRAAGDLDCAHDGSVAA